MIVSNVTVVSSHFHFATGFNFVTDFNFIPVKFATVYVVT